MEWMTMQALRLRRGGKVGQTCPISEEGGGGRPYVCGRGPLPVYASTLALWQSTPVP